MRTRSSSRRRDVAGLLLATIGIAISAGALLYYFLAVKTKSEPPTAFISSNQVTLQFGLSRDALTRSARFDLCSADNAARYRECPKNEQQSDTTPTATTKPSPRPTIVAVGLASDLVDGERQFPANQITTAAVNVGATGILVNITANPREPTRILDGTYKGRLIIDRDDGSQIDSAVTVGLSERAGAVSMKVLLALLLGAFAGGLIKWLDDSFGPIAALRRRQRRIENFLRLRERENPPRLPIGVLRRLDDVRLAIRSFDAEGVADTLQHITSNQDALIRFDSGLEALESEIATQRSLLHRVESAGAEGAIAMETSKVKELRSRVWPWEQADKVMDELDRAKQEFGDLTLAMRRAIYDPEKYTKLVDYLALKRISGGEDDPMEKLLQSTVLVESKPSLSEKPDGDASTKAIDDPTGIESRGQSQEYVPDMRRGFGLWLLDNAWWLTLVVLALFVVFVGYQTQFVDDPGFQGDLTDYVQLAAWALAIQVAGGTIIDTAGKLRTSRAST